MSTLPSTGVYSGAEKKDGVMKVNSTWLTVPQSRSNSIHQWKAMREVDLSFHFAMQFTSSTCLINFATRPLLKPWQTQEDTLSRCSNTSNHSSHSHKTPPMQKAREKKKTPWQGVKGRPPRNSLSPGLLVSEKSIMDARPMLSRFVLADWTIIPYVSSSYLQGKLTKLCCSCLLTTKGIRSRNLARWCSRVRMPYAFWSSQPRSRWSKSGHIRCGSLKGAQPTKNLGRKENHVKTPS